jgi:DNA (cytosine-5)-methyltransferase 1
VIRAVSLCSGIGGFDLAAEMAGMTIVGQVEIDPFCRRVLAKHWSRVKRLSDLWETKGDEFGPIDALLAGIPCQPFSVAGKQAGTKDVRNLWEPFLSFVEVSRPTFLCLENVPGLVRMALDDWLADLGSLGYTALPLAVPAAAIGAPQIRERIFIVAHAECVPDRTEDIGNKTLWQDADGPASGAGGSDSGDVAHAEGECGELRQAERAGPWRLAGGSVDVAHASSARYGERRGATSGAIRDEARRAESDGRCGTLEHSEEQPIGTGLCPNRSERFGWGRLSDADGPHDGGREAQPGLGGIAPGASCGLDRYRRVMWPGWPAPPGQAQHDYEPPRTTDGGKHRRQRLKALGNCVVPAQAYPILCAIVDAIRAEQAEAAS